MVMDGEREKVGREGEGRKIREISEG